MAFDKITFCLFVHRMKLKKNEKRMIKNYLISENEIILYSGIYLTRLSFILKNRNKTIYYNWVFTVGSFSNVSVHPI